MKQYGIDAEFGNLKIANLTTSTIEDFIQINEDPKMFNGLKIKMGMHEVFLAYFHSHNPNNAHVAFNKAADWNKYKNTCWQNYSSGYWASPDKKNIIYHELAHWPDFNSRPF